MAAPKRVFPVETNPLAPQPMLIGIEGPPNGGKTVSSLRLATGIQRVRGGPIRLIDTEAGRSRAHMARFPFDYVPFHPPFHSERFAEAIAEHVADNPACIIVDSLSDEHDGEGGMLERHEQVIDSMAKDKKDDWGRRDQLSQAAWARVKPFRNRLITRLLHVTVPLILTFRAREKIKPVKQQKDGREITVPTNVGFQAIAPAEIVKCLTCVCLLPANAEGKAIWKSGLATEDFLLKRPYFLADILTDGLIDEAMGEKLAVWASGSGGISTTATALGRVTERPPNSPKNPAGGLAAADTAPPAGTVDEAELLMRWDAKLEQTATAGMYALECLWADVPARLKPTLKAALERRHKPHAREVDAAQPQPEPATGELPL